MHTMHVATLDDLQGIEILMREYFKESVYSELEYDQENVFKLINEWISNFCFVAKDNYDNIIAVAAFVIHGSFFKGTVADMEIFYVTPKYRGTTLARELVNIIMQNADQNGVLAINANTVSGRDSSLFTNLFKKFGFEIVGIEMIKVAA
jgi:N-acetylglutamate synthase-like GNAT family acetyltransferase